jgi:hypothetical protein
VVAYNLGLAERHKQVIHSALERNSEEVAVPIAVRMEAAGAVHMVVVHTEVEVVVPIAVRMEAAGAVRAARMEVEVVHTVVAVPNLAVAVDLDHKTWIIPSRQIFIIAFCTIRVNAQYHTTGVEANRQVSIREAHHCFRGIRRLESALMRKYGVVSLHVDAIIQTIILRRDDQQSLKVSVRLTKRIHESIENGSLSGGSKHHDGRVS